jgi:hypothetical protein
MTVPCKVCRQPIANDAVFCHECKNYQDWTRYLFRWKDVVVALAALAPLWLGAQALRDFVRNREDADIKILALRCDAEIYRVAASNTGGAAGILGSAKLEFTTSQGNTPTEIELRARTSSPRDTMLAPGAAEVFDFEAFAQGKKTQIPFPATGRPCAALARFVVRSFDGGERTAATTCDCP